MWITEGKIDLKELKIQIRPETKMIALMWANNETGVISPIDENRPKIAERTSGDGFLWHVLQAVR